MLNLKTPLELIMLFKWQGLDLWIGSLELIILIRGKEEEQEDKEHQEDPLLEVDQVAISVLLVKIKFLSFESY